MLALCDRLTTHGKSLPLLGTLLYNHFSKHNLATLSTLRRQKWTDIKNVCIFEYEDAPHTAP